MDRAAIAEGAIFILERPADRTAPVQPDIHPLMKAIEQGWRAVAPLARHAVDQQPAAAATLAQRLELQHRLTLAGRNQWAKQFVELAETVVVQLELPGFDIGHHAAGYVANGEQHALVAVALSALHRDAERAVGDQRHHDAAMHRLPVRQEAPAATDRRALMRWQFVEFLDRGPIVQRVDHVLPGGGVEGVHQLAQFVRMLRREVHAFGKILGMAMQGPVVEIDRLAFDLQGYRQPAIAIESAIGPAFVILFGTRRLRLRIVQHGGEADAMHRLRRLAVRHLQRFGAA